MSTPTPDQVREALMKLADDYAHNHADEAVALIVTEEPVDCGSATKRAELDAALRRFIDAHSAPVPEPVANAVLRTAIQQAILALEELDGPGYLIGGVMHYRIGLLLPKLNEALASLASPPPAQPAQAATDDGSHE